MLAAVSPASFERSRNRGTNLESFGSHGNGGGSSSHALHWFSSKMIQLDILELMAGGYGVQNAVPQKGSEMNLTLGGIDLNNSGRLRLRKMWMSGRKLWREHLRQLLMPALVVGHDTAFRHESHDSFEGSAELGRGRRPVKSLVVGRPISLALEDIDGSPSFLEMALHFIEQYAIHFCGVGRETSESFDTSDLGTVMGFLACENFWDFRENRVQQCHKVAVDAQ
ncbi:unnamed protein product [Sphagnum tenellum]